jgi:hypothetical protein
MPTTRCHGTSGSAFSVSGERWRGFADDFKAAHDGVLGPQIGQKLLVGHARKVLLDNARRIEDVGQIRVILGHKSAWRSRE